MNPGYLSDYFEGVAAKKLNAVEADETCSNQHEYHATKNVRAFLGSPEEKKMRIPARFLYLTDDDPDPIVEDAFLTLYNCRKGKPRAPEYHLCTFLPQKYP